MKLFRDLPLPLSLESVFLVANASSVLFISSQVLAHVMASGFKPVRDPETSFVLVEFETPIFMAVLIPPDAMVLSIRANGVDSHFFRCGLTTLVPDGFFRNNFSLAVDFCKRSSAQKLSA